MAHAQLVLFAALRNPDGGFPILKEAKREPAGSTDAAIRTAWHLRRDPTCRWQRIQVIDREGKIVRDHEFFDGAWRNQLKRS